MTASARLTWAVEAVALEPADFGEQRFDKIFGVHVAALWRSQPALAVVRAHLAPGGALFVISQEPGLAERAGGQHPAQRGGSTLDAVTLAVQAA